MKLLHVMGTFYVGGAEMFIKNLIILQKEQGIDVELLVLSDSDNFIIQEIRRKGIAVHSLHPKGKGIYNPINIIKVIPYLKKYDLLHVHMFPEQYWVSMAKIISFSKVILVTTEHFSENPRRRFLFFKIVERFLYKYAYNAIVACSDDALQTLQKYSPQSNNISIPNGVDVGNFENAKPYSKKERFGIENDSFVITMVATFKEPKRQDLLIKALKYLPKNVHAIFCGICTDIAKYKKIAEDSDVSLRVHFLGVCNDVDRILKTSDLVALFSENEGLSLSSVEGMAGCGPIIASNVRGLTPVIKDAGILVENEPHKIAEAISQLFNDKDYYQKISFMCRERSKMYDIRVMANKYHELYSHLISRSIDKN